MFDTIETQILFGIISILIIVIGYLLYKTRKLENFDATTDINTAINNKYTADIDSIRNLAQIAKNIMTNTDNLTLPTNIKIPGILTVENNTIINGNLNGKNTTVDNLNAKNTTVDNLNAKNTTVNKLVINEVDNSFCINDLCLGKDLFKKILSQTVYAGFATNGAYVSLPIYEGSRNLVTSGDTWDYVYVNRGWKIILYQHNFNGTTKIVDNTTSNLPLYYYLEGLVDQITSYDAIWIGY